MKEKVIEFLLFLASLIAVITTVLILYILFSKTISFFKIVSLKEFFLDDVWAPLFFEKRFGIWPLVVGSFLVTTIALITAGPFGIMAALFLSEYSSKKLRNFIKPLLEILAGIPSIVYGYFALTIVTPKLMNIIPSIHGFNALSAGLVLGLMLIPTVASLSEDALHKTPRLLKEASVSLGARKIDTIFYVILPMAKPNILSAMFLAFSRSMGETMIVAIAAGLMPNLTLDVREPIETMTAYIVQVSMGDISQDSLEYLTIFAVAFILFLITFLFNLAAKLVLKNHHIGRVL